MPIIRRNVDMARKMLQGIDSYGSAWEGGATEDVRVERAGPPEDVAPPDSTGRPSGALLVVVALAVLACWR